MYVIDQIGKSNNFHLLIRKFKVIVGLAPYSSNNKPQKSMPLTLNNYNNTLYRYTLGNPGNVAFIPSNHTYPCSLIMVLGLIFGGVESGYKIISQMHKLNIPMQNLAIFLYNYGYLLINSTDIDANNFNSVLSSAKSILILGKDNFLKQNFKLQLMGINADIGAIIHPSAQNFDKPDYHKIWFNYDNSAIEQLKGKLDLSDYILRVGN